MVGSPEFQTLPIGIYHQTGDQQQIHISQIVESGYLLGRVKQKENLCRQFGFERILSVSLMHHCIRETPYRFIGEVKSYFRKRVRWFRDDFRFAPSCPIPSSIPIRTRIDSKTQFNLLPLIRCQIQADMLPLLFCVMSAKNFITLDRNDESYTIRVFRTRTANPISNSKRMWGLSGSERFHSPNVSPLIPCQGG